MAELRFFHGTKAQYDAATNKKGTDFYVTTETIDGKVFYALYLGENLIAQAKTVAELEAEIIRAKAAEAKLTEDLAAEVKAREEAVADVKADLEQAVVDAKTYSIAKADKANENILEAYKLVDEDGVQVGETINIYKDSALKGVEFDGETQSLIFTYALADGTEKVVTVDVSAFLHEGEYAEGLQVIDHVVSVKIDGTSEEFLTVSKNGVKISGVQAAIDAAVKAEKERAVAAEKKLTEDLAAEVARATQAEADEKAAREKAVADEKARAEAAEKSLSDKIAAAETALNAAIKAEQAAREAAVAAEKKAREEADAALQTALDAEIARATAVEDALQVALNDEVAAREKAVADEVARAEAAEKKLTEDLAAEVVRATEAEAALQVALNDEVARATEAEDKLRATTVIEVKPVAHSAIHVVKSQSTKGQVISVGMQWMGIAYEAATEGDLNIALENKESDIRIASDITLSAPVSVGHSATIDLNNQKLTNQVDNLATDVILVGKDATVKIEGDGQVVAVSGNDGYPVIADGTVEIYGGYFESGADAKGMSNACIYARGNGKVYIYGGEFRSADGSFVLNKKDADRETTEIKVMGGRFHNFNPADNASEGAHTNFVADGYVSIEVEPNVWEVMLQA